MGDIAINCEITRTADAPPFVSTRYSWGESVMPGNGRDILTIRISGKL